MFDTGINAGDVYRHFKGNRYEIVTLAQDAEDGSLQVVYKALYPPYLTFVRPYADFTEELDREKYPAATQIHRFEPEEGTLEKEADKTVATQAGTQPESREESAPEAVAGYAPVATFFTKTPPGTVKKEESAGKVIYPKREKEEPVYDQPLDEPVGMEGKINPMLLRFINCDEHDAKIAVLKEMRGKITEEMFAVMFMSMDVPMPDVSKDERYEILLKRLETLNEFDGKRFRKG